MSRILFILMLLFGITTDAKQIKIAVIDSGYSNNLSTLKVCPNGLHDFTDNGMTDKMGHGTVILGIIADNLKDVDYCVHILKIYDNASEDTAFSTHLAAYKYVLSLNDKIDVINYSSRGYTHSNREEALVKQLLEKDIKFVTAAGNENRDLDNSCSVWPACIPGVISVGNIDKNGEKVSNSNYGKVITAWEYGYKCVNNICMNGSSMSTAVYTTIIARKLYKQK